MSDRDPNQPAPPVDTDWGSRAHVQTIVLTAATAIGMYLCYRMVLPFLAALTAALALAVMFTPLQRWLVARMKRPSLAASIAVLLIAVTVVVPVSFVVQQLVVQAAESAQLVEARVGSGEWRQTLEKQTALAPMLTQIENRFDLPASVASLVAWLKVAAAALVKGSLMQLIEFFLTFYLLFFFLRDREAILQSLKKLSPLSVGDMNRMFSQIGNTIHATIYGTLAVSAAQGLLGGLMFWWLGLSAPLLWGMIMALLAVVPVLGAFVVWVPAALFLALEGDWGKALILFAWGMLVVGTVDNLLRPFLVGQRLKQHTLLAFLAVVGGLMLFGATGLILGPVVLAFTTFMLEIWTRRGKAEIKAAEANVEDHAGLILVESRSTPPSASN